MNKAATKERFDAICPMRGREPSAFLFAARTAGITTLYVFLSDERKSLWERCATEESTVIFMPERWYSPTKDVQDVYLSFSRFFYENLIWDLTDADEFSKLLTHFSGKEEFLTTYKSVCREAIKNSKSKIALGLEAVGNVLGRDFFDSSVYRKIMLDLTDELVKKGMTLGYAIGHPVCDLSPVVLRRFSELRGDLLPASFAEKPDDVGHNLQKTVLSARAAGCGSYIQYSVRERKVIPNTPSKENP